MTVVDSEDITVCLVALMNGLEEYGVPRELLVQSFQERLLTLESTATSDLALLRRLARLTDADGRD